MKNTLLLPVALVISVGFATETQARSWYDNPTWGIRFTETKPPLLQPTAHTNQDGEEKRSTVSIDLSPDLPGFLKVDGNVFSDVWWNADLLGGRLDGVPGVSSSESFITPPVLPTGVSAVGSTPDDPASGLLSEPALDLSVDWSSIPGPGAIPLLLLGGLMSRRRRR